MIQNKHRIFTASALKWLAMFTMIIDHIGAVLIRPLMYNYSSFTVIETSWADIYDIFRLIGRIAFPIFCFLIVEGYQHTSNKRNYLIRLILFAVISEIPFDLALSNHWTAFNHQNVFFTLALGLIAIWLIDTYENIFIQIFSVLIVAYFAEWLNTDYGAYGVILICILFMFRNNRELQCIIGGVFALRQMTVALSFIPIYFYNGEKGRWNYKWMYWIYPAHLLILALIFFYYFG